MFLNTGSLKEVIAYWSFLKIRKDTIQGARVNEMDAMNAAKRTILKLMGVSEIDVDKGMRRDYKQRILQYSLALIKHRKTESRLSWLFTLVHSELDKLKGGMTASQSTGGRMKWGDVHYKPKHF